MAGRGPIPSGISVDAGREAVEEAGEAARALDMGAARFGRGYVGIVATNEVEGRYFDVE